VKIDDELAIVIELACLTEDRTKEEQRALLHIAQRLDKKRAKQVVTNPHPVKPYLERRVESTWDPQEAWEPRPARTKTFEDVPLELSRP
jgi:hypothetical protein